MIILFIVIIAVAVYFTTGFSLACMRTPRMWRVSRHMYQTEKKVETSVRQQFGWCMFLWPFFIPVSLLIQFFEATSPYPENSHPHSLTTIIRKRDPQRKAEVL